MAARYFVRRPRTIRKSDDFRGWKCFQNFGASNSLWNLCKTMGAPAQEITAGFDAADTGDRETTDRWVCRLLPGMAFVSCVLHPPMRSRRTKLSLQSIRLLRLLNSSPSHAHNARNVPSPGESHS